MSAIPMGYGLAVGAGALSIHWVLDGIVLGVVLCLVPPGMPGGQMEAECAPGVLDGIVVGVMPFDEGARGQWRSELHFEELSQG